jgi:hypothetical protein
MQRRTNLDVSVSGCVMQRRFVVQASSVDIRPGTEQTLGDLEVSVVAGLVKRRPTCVRHTKQRELIDADQIKHLAGAIRAIYGQQLTRQMIKGKNTPHRFCTVRRPAKGFPFEAQRKVHLFERFICLIFRKSPNLTGRCIENLANKVLSG